MAEPWRAWGERLWWAPIAALYLAAVNPYELPDTFDNLIYLRGARSLAETGAFTFGGWVVWDWPPGFSAALAVPWALGLESVVAAKLVVVAAVVAAAAFARAVLRREGVAGASLLALLFALAPYAFLQGTRVMADWPFVTVAYGFHLLLPGLLGPRPWRAAVALGLLLGYAALVRHVGVILGVALVVSAWQAWRGAPLGARVRAALPAAFASLLGAGLFLGWKLSLLPAVRAGAAWSEYQEGGGFLFHPDVLHWGRLLFDVLFHGTALGARVGLPEVALSLAGLVVAAVTGLGLVAHVRARGVSPALAVAVTNLVLILCLEWKWSRYLLVSAPYVVLGFAGGVRFIAGAAAARFEAARSLRRLGRPLLLAWALVLVCLDAFVVARGNGTTHGPLSPLLARDEASFYLGDWRDVNAACRAIRASSSAGAVLWFGRDDLKYPAHWCDRPIVQTKDVVVGADFWPTVCGRRSPFAPGTGLALEDAAGRAAPRETRVPAPVRSTDCHHVAFAVLPTGDALPPGGPAVRASARVGAYDLLTLSP